MTPAGEHGRDRPLRNSVGMMSLSEKWEIVEANAAMLEMLEVESIAELRGVPSHEFVAPQFRVALDTERSKRQQGVTSTYETVLVGRRGTRREIIVSATPLCADEKLIGTIASCLDVTHLRHAEEELQDTLQRYQAVVNALGDGVMIIANTGKILEANASAARILNVATDTLGGIFPLPPAWRVSDEQGRELNALEIPAAITLRTGQPCRNVVLQIERPDHSKLWLSINTEPLFNEGEALPRAVVASLHDISELKESHYELSVREARLRRLLDAVPDLLFLLSNDGVYLDYRASRPELLFRPPDEFLGRRQEDVLPPEVLEPCQQVLRRAVSTGRPQSVEYSSEYLGARQFFEARVTPFDSDTMLMIIRDVTEARVADQRMRQHDQERAHLARLGALGEMVAGISHEINQPLHAIANFAAASLNVLEAGEAAAKDQVTEWLRKIARQAFRASEIVKRFRQFSSPVANISAVPVSELLQESLELTTGEYRRRSVKAEIRNAAEDRPFRGDRVQIQQVLVNFLVNAGEALDGNSPKDRLVVVTARVEGENLVCEVADNGVGLPAGPTAQLFDAFFTTKPNGLGLGLAISRTIVEGQGGRIWARLNVPRGAIFGFSLPPSNGP